MKYLNLFVLLLIFASCEDRQAKSLAKAEMMRDSLTQVIAQKDAELTDIMGTFNEIQNGFREINAIQGRIDLDSRNPENSAIAGIRENLSYIHHTLTLNKERIARMQQQLKTSSFNISKFKETIEQLNRQLAEKSEQITHLENELRDRDIKIEAQSQQIASLTDDVNALTTANAAQAQTVASQDEALNTAWYVFGTKSELKEQRILKNGEVLKTDQYNKDYFTKIDIRVVKSIKLYSKNVTLMTVHPEGSYALERDAQKQYTLHITNPAQFWSVSRYLVVQVK